MTANPAEDGDFLRRPLCDQLGECFGNSPQPFGKRLLRRSADSAMHHHAMRSAAKTDEMGDRMTEALNLLSADGYFNIQSLTPQGDQFLANATQNGRNVSVLVDPQSGKVTNRS